MPRIKDPSIVGVPQIPLNATHNHTSAGCPRITRRRTCLLRNFQPPPPPPSCLPLKLRNRDPFSSAGPFFANFKGEVGRLTYCAFPFNRVKDLKPRPPPRLFSVSFAKLRRVFFAFSVFHANFGTAWISDQYKINAPYETSVYACLRT